MKLTKSLLKVIKQKEKAREVTLAADKKMFSDFVQQFFDEHSEVTAIRWEQYTPSFNDGEPCTFSLNDLMVSTSGFEPIEDDVDECDDSFDSDYHFHETNPALAGDITQLSDFMDHVSDSLEETFGDGVRVTIQRGKDPFVTDYYCD